MPEASASKARRVLFRKLHVPLSAKRMLPLAFSNSLHASVPAPPFNSFAIWIGCAAAESSIGGQGPNEEALPIKMARSVSTPPARGVVVMRT